MRRPTVVRCRWSILVLLVGLALLPGCRRSATPTPPEPPPPTQPGTESPSTPPPSPAQASRAPAGTLWASPTTGPPIPLDWLPPETQLVLRVRPQAILATGEGERLVQGLGPDAAAWLEAWTARTGLALGDIQTWTVAWSAAPSGRPQVTHVLDLVDGSRKVSETWTSDPPRESPAGPWWPGPDGTALLRPGGAPSRVIIGPSELVEEIAAASGAAPLWPRLLDHMRKASNRNHHLVLLGAPHFLFADGHLLWTGRFGPLRAPVERLLEPDVPAAMLSLHFEPYFFGELRLASRPEQDAFLLGQRLLDGLQHWPGAVRRHLAGPIHPYWQELAAAFPEMLDYLVEQSRVAVEGDQAVLTFALPPAAAHNLVLASELSLATTAAPEQPGRTTPPDPRDWNAWLAMPIDLAFPQLSLEAALEELQTVATQQAPGATIPFRIRILGEDLKQAGITRNQQIRDVHLAHTPVAEVLTQLVIRANPGAIAARPSSSEQQLVWVVARPPGDTQEAVVITTRTAADSRNWKLPVPFLSP